MLLPKIGGDRGRFVTALSLRRNFFFARQPQIPVDSASEMRFREGSFATIRSAFIPPFLEFTH
jgi:hypothetical protein